jgi:hypothetical protein
MDTKIFAEIDQNLARLGTLVRESRKRTGGLSDFANLEPTAFATVVTTVLGPTQELAQQMRQHLTAYVKQLDLIASSVTRTSDDTFSQE